MFGLGNLFSGLGSLFTMPNMLSALEFMGKGMETYGQIDSILNRPKMPDFDRLDQQGNMPRMGAPAAGQGGQGMPQMPAGDRARAFASARTHLAERGVGPGGAFNNPLESAPGFAGSPESMSGLYAMVGQGGAQGAPFGAFGAGQALPYGPLWGPQGAVGADEDEMYGYGGSPYGF